MQEKDKSLALEILSDLKRENKTIKILLALSIIANVIIVILK